MNPAEVTNLILWGSALYISEHILEPPVLETCWKHFVSSALLIQVEDMADLPYRAARLYIPSSRAKRQEWYIQYSAFDAVNQKLKKFTEFHVNNIQGSEKVKRQWAKRRCNELNNLLAKGFHYNPVRRKIIDEAKKFEQRKRVLPVSDIMNLIYSEIDQNFKEKGKDPNKKNRNLEMHRSVFGRFLKWLNYEGKNGITPDLITQDDMERFLKYQLEQYGVTLRTRDNYLSIMKRFFNYCVRKDIIEKSPMKELKRKAKTSSRNIAYTKDQQKELLHFARKFYPEFEFLQLFVYYTLMRSDEISLLRVHMIREDKIFIPQEIAKTDFDRIVTIPKHLEKFIDAKELRKLPPDYYVFSKGFVPGPNWYDSENFGKRFRENVLDKIEWATPNHTLYSWKHTGIVELKKAGIEDAYIMMQSGHRSLSAYQVYLKSLGIQDNPIIQNNYPLPGY